MMNRALEAIIKKVKADKYQSEKERTSKSSKGQYVK